MILPRPLRPGGKIGICTTSSPVKPERLTAAVEALQALGFEVETAPSAYGHCGFLAAPDDVRRRELEEMFAREDIDAVFCARGGVGASRLLATLDTALIARGRKPFLGFSDITALHWLLYARQEFISYSGPVAVEWDGSSSERSLRNALRIVMGDAPDDLLADFPRDNIRVLRGQGKLTGRLLPGNLTMITTLLGTPFLPPLAGALLLIEDINEPPYRIDRMLFHLRNAGVLHQLVGLLCGDLGGEAGEPASEEVQQSLLDATRGLDYPLVINLPHGHGPERVTLPVGAPVEFDLDRITMGLRLPAFEEAAA